MSTILERIAAGKRVEVEELKIILPLDMLKAQMPMVDGRPFGRAIRADGIRIIAELKKASPSKGLLKPNFDPRALAAEYGEGGAAALSVLTEKMFFQGRPEYLAIAKRASGLPVLCKDFVIDEYQLHYARAMQADAVLLIAKLLTRRMLQEFIRVADSLGMDCLVEVHNEPEIEIALDAGARVIGINNRNLDDFSATLETAERLAALVPSPVIKVAESGIFTAEDVKRLRAAGYNCFLIGEALAKADDPAALLRLLRRA